MKSRMVNMLVLLLALGLAGCEEPGVVTNRDVGTVAGGVLGGVLGAQVRGSGRTAATIGGAILGGYLGGSIGRQMDEADRAHLAHTLEYNRVHQASRWRDPDRNKEVVFVPVSTYHYRGRVCRRFTSTIIIDGRREKAVGRACRRHNGTWYIVR